MYKITRGSSAMLNAMTTKRNFVCKSINCWLRAKPGCSLNSGWLIIHKRERVRGSPHAIQPLNAISKYSLQSSNIYTH